MKNIDNLHNKALLILSMVFITVFSCERDLSEDAIPASFPTTAEVFANNTFVDMGSDFYLPFANSKLDAFSVDTSTGYKGSKSYRVDVPNVDDPTGNYAGAILRIDGSPRDLSNYDALTFWAKASQGVGDVSVGFGLDFLQDKHQANANDLSIGTAWAKYTIPIPVASKLIEELGVFWYSAGTQGTGGFAYTLWFDEIKFEKLGTISQPRPFLSEGQDLVIDTFIGVELEVKGLKVAFNLTSGIEQTLNVAPGYYDFTSSNPSIATVNEFGKINVIGTGTTIITATLNGIDAKGSLIINSSGDFVHAPTPTRDASKVISIYSDHYTNAPVDFYNGYWQPWQTTESADFVVNGDNVLNYTNFNFVGTQFANPSIDATNYSNLHLNMYIPGEVPSNLDFLISIINFGPDGVDGGGDDTRQRISFKASDFEANTWSTLEIPITLGDRRNMALIIYENTNGSQLENFYLDNIYFYDNGVVGPKLVPEDAPEAPTEDEVTNNVISIFSDAYTDIPNESLNFTPLGATLTIENIASNNVLKYLNLNFIEQEFAPNTIDASMADMMHIDVWSPVDNDMRITLKDYGADGSSFSEASIVLEGLEQNQWKSYDIPLTDFNGSPERSHIGRIIIQNGASTPDFTGTLFIDNIYFYTN
ncbi:hypothetical protein GCM10023311_26650 [Flaviramulus aquimarinus]|uniref:Glycosyl hydrolase family 16 n=1 Tax=Flaviramulus aquimarinus TaxID=1170456 RepID=A0ABP9FDM9_9FLAO